MLTLAVSDSMALQPPEPTSMIQTTRRSRCLWCRLCRQLLMVYYFTGTRSSIRLCSTSSRRRVVPLKRTSPHQSTQACILACICMCWIVISEYVYTIHVCNCVKSRDKYQQFSLSSEAWKYQDINIVGIEDRFFVLLRLLVGFHDIIEHLGYVSERE